VFFPPKNLFLYLMDRSKFSGYSVFFPPKNFFLYLMIRSKFSGEVIVGGSVADLALDHGRVGVQVVADVVHHFAPAKSTELVKEFQGSIL
jgi:hypothetical protein